MRDPRLPRRTLNAESPRLHDITSNSAALGVVPACVPLNQPVFLERHTFYRPVGTQPFKINITCGTLQTAREWSPGVDLNTGRQLVQGPRTERERHFRGDSGFFRFLVFFPFYGCGIAGKRRRRASLQRTLQSFYEEAGRPTNPRSPLMKDSVQPLSLSRPLRHPASRPSGGLQTHKGHLALPSPNRALNGQLQTPGPGSRVRFMVSDVSKTRIPPSITATLAYMRQEGPSDLIRLILSRARPLNFLTRPTQTRPSTPSLAD